MTAWLYQAVVQAVLGPPVRLLYWLAGSAPLTHLTDAPRKRPKQPERVAMLLAELRMAML